MFDIDSQNALSALLLVIPFVLAGVNIRLAKKKKLTVIVNASLALLIAAGALGAYLENRQEKAMIADSGGGNPAFANMLYDETADGYHIFKNRNGMAYYAMADSYELPKLVTKGSAVRVLLPEGNVGVTSSVDAGGNFCILLPSDSLVRRDLSGYELTALIIGFFAMAVFDLIMLLVNTLRRIKGVKL